jgi:hypothetical protein
VRTEAPHIFSDFEVVALNDGSREIVNRHKKV